MINIIITFNRQRYQPIETLKLVLICPRTTGPRRYLVRETYDFLLTHPSTRLFRNEMQAGLSELSQRLLGLLLGTGRNKIGQ